MSEKSKKKGLRCHLIPPFDDYHCYYGIDLIIPAINKDADKSGNLIQEPIDCCSKLRKDLGCLMV